MKRTHLGLLLASTALATACGTTSMNNDAPSSPSRAPAQNASAGETSGGNSQAAPSSAVASVTLAQHLDPSSDIHNERSVHFELEKFEIGQAYQPLIERHAKYLGTHPELAIRIEGNADERGSAEYNLALGQKRAQAVLAALKVYGIKESQVEAVSFGEERPKAGAHDEGAWAQNRRADLVYPTR
jgi:peptidoglycan-associated lipoprotein